MNLTSPILYFDTSVFGGYYDKEFLKDTRRLWSDLEKGKVGVAISDLLKIELEGAPIQVRELYGDLDRISEHTGLIYRFQITDAMERLADAYLAAQVVSPNYRDDALHVAAATIFGVRTIVSWNYTHLVNTRRESGFNSVNLLHDQGLVRIVSPREVIDYEG